MSSKEMENNIAWLLSIYLHTETWILLTAKWVKKKCPQEAEEAVNSQKQVDVVGEGEDAVLRKK